MNLLLESWIPVRRRHGGRDWIAPHQLSDPDVVAFDADRPDFNGALAQFAIGLLQTATPVDSELLWKKLLNSPPDFQTLQEWFGTVATAFEFDGDGPRFMQDSSVVQEDCSVNSIAALLIDSPGENALPNNTDHFIKRGRVDAMCPHCAATALFTLQVNAPSGGKGYRTGLRGGGPLTTLLLGPASQSLWQCLWMNVLERSAFLALCGSTDREADYLRFPWLADISLIQGKSGETAPVQVHPDHIFWAMPRRIRLDMDALPAGACNICGRHSERLIRQFITKNYGINYKGAWDHPLSPYYEGSESWLPQHPQPGGFGYRHWLAWVLGVDADKQRPARVISHALHNRRRQLEKGLRLWVFGFDMKKGKVRCWYESTLPLYNVADCDSDALGIVEATVGEWLAGAKLAASMLQGAVKDAWFSADARGDFSAVDAAFWGGTEAAFYGQLRTLIEAVRTNPLAVAEDLATRQAWHGILVRTAMRLFDGQFVGAGRVEREKPRRVAEAYRQLEQSLSGPKMRQALRLPEPEKKRSKTEKAAATAA